MLLFLGSVKCAKLRPILANLWGKRETHTFYCLSQAGSKFKRNQHWLNKSVHKLIHCTISTHQCFYDPNHHWFTKHIDMFLPIYTSRNQNAISCNFKQNNQSIISGNVSENMNWHVYPDHTKALAVLVMTEQSLRPFNKPLETIISCVILSSDNILVIKGLLVFPMQLQPASNPVTTEMTQLLSSVYNSYIHFSSISQLLGPVSLRFVMSYWFLHKNASNLFELLYYFLLYKIIFVKRFCLLYLRLFQYIITMYKDKSKSKISKGNSSSWHRTYTII